SLLAGATSSIEIAGPLRARRWGLWIGAACVIGAIALTVSGFFVKESEAQAGTFFSSGILLLTACLAFLWALMRRVRDGTLQGDATRLNLAGLSVRNGTRNPLRSLLTAGLLASAAFLLVAVELFRREPDTNYLQ